MNILGLNYTVESHEDRRTLGKLGQCDASSQVLRIASDLPRDGKESSLLHEIIHAVEMQLGLDLSEAQVKGLETGLYQVFTQNGVSLTPLLTSDTP